LTRIARQVAVDDAFRTISMHLRNGPQHDIDAARESGRGAAPDGKQPTIVAAVMQDADGDGRADRARPRAVPSASI
jgi:hypothetical protein